jgi:hypothetical protein
MRTMRRDFTCRAWLAVTPVLLVLSGAAALASCGERASSQTTDRTPEATSTAVQDATGAPPEGSEAAGGTIWVLVRFDPSVSIIEAGIAQVVQQVALASDAITVGLLHWDGAVWVGDLRGALHRIDVAKQELVGSVPLDWGPVGLSAAAHGLYTVDVDAGSVVRHDLRTGASLGVVMRVERPEAMAAGPDAAWVLGARRTELHRLDADAVQSRVMRTEFALPGYMAYGFGSLWYYQSNGRLLRVDPSSGAVQATIDTPDAAFATGIIVGRDAVWICAPDARQILRIDPASNQVTRRIDVAGMPLQVAELGATLWVVLTHDNAVIRIDADTGAETARILMEKPTAIIAVR